MSDVQPEIVEALFSKYMGEENYIMALCLFCYCRDFSMPVFTIRYENHGDISCLYTVLKEGQPVHAAAQAESLQLARQAAALKLLTKLSKEPTKELEPSTNYPALLGELCGSYRIGERRVVYNNRFSVPAYADVGGELITAWGTGNTMKEARATAIRGLYYKIVRIRKISAGNH